MTLCGVGGVVVMAIYVASPKLLLGSDSGLGCYNYVLFTSDPNPKYQSIIQIPNANAQYKSSILIPNPQTT